jgi:hypothetical protein
VVSLDVSKEAWKELALLQLWWADVFPTQNCASDQHGWHKPYKTATKEMEALVTRKGVGNLQTTRIVA